MTGEKKVWALPRVGRQMYRQVENVPHNILYLEPLTQGALLSGIRGLTRLASVIEAFQNGFVAKNVVDSLRGDSPHPWYYDVKLNNEQLYVTRAAHIDLVKNHLDGEDLLLDGDISDGNLTQVRVWAKLGTQKYQLSYSRTVEHPGVLTLKHVIGLKRGTEGPNVASDPVYTGDDFNMIRMIDEGSVVLKEKKDQKHYSKMTNLLYRLAMHGFPLEASARETLEQYKRIIDTDHTSLSDATAIRITPLIEAIDKDYSI